MKRKKTPHFIINSEERKIGNKKEILKEYQKYYESLLQTRPTENLQQKKIEQETNTKFQKVIDDKSNLKEKK